MVFRFFSRLCFFGAPVLLALLGIASLFLNRVFGDFDSERIDRATLIRVMQLRNFQTFSKEKQRKMTDRCEAEFGRQSKQKPIFQFSDTEKKIYVYFQEKRSEKKHGQEKNHQDKSRENEPPSASLPYFESNLLLMARIRYFQWMNDCDKLDPEQRREMMNGIADDMKYWQTVYMDFLRAAGLPIPSLLELIREFEEMINDFKKDATAEEIVRIDAFKQRMNTAIVAREVQGASENFGNWGKDVKSAVSNALGNFILPNKTDRNETKRNQNEN